MPAFIFISLLALQASFFGVLFRLACECAYKKVKVDMSSGFEPGGFDTPPGHLSPPAPDKWRRALASVSISKNYNP